MQRNRSLSGMQLPNQFKENVSQKKGACMQDIQANKRIR